MSSERYRFFLLSDEGGALVPVRGRRRHGRPSPPVERARRQQVGLLGLLDAIERLARRGSGPAAWAPVFEDPLAFLLDAISDGLLVRGRNGEVVFANALANQLELGERAFTAYEEFERGGESYAARGLRLELPDGPFTFTLVTRVRS
ncbi:MAG: hypothetical protein KF760_33860 [Candidatus Eremiobacteraeota bacterium]|nr:hypothetical protein [Candidatus Eremiobacteraeota bacterium]MCW5871523.1 hypothetical protein [Candidatus Eremiobacteraeota bacterium]